MRTHEVRAGGVRIVDEGIGLDAGGEGSAMVGVAALEVGRDGGDAFAGDLGAAGAVEVDHLPPVDLAAERREVVTHGLDVDPMPLTERCHRSIVGQIPRAATGAVGIIRHR